MFPVEITPGVFWIGVNDRTTDLFEGLWPVAREGVSYNAYFIRDEKQAIIDLSRSMKEEQFFDQIACMTDLAKLDYVVLNHMEPDHTGVVKTLRRIAPNVQLVGAPKTVRMLNSFFGITDNVRAVANGEELRLGTRALKFVHTPFVHWPETMVTYEPSDRILFSCDAFGSYGALRGSIFDDQYEDLAFYKREALRYFANIVARFSSNVLKAISKLADVPVSIIAPSHGLIWRKQPELIIELYRQWSEQVTQPRGHHVALVYGSMYGYTENMVNAVSGGIGDSGASVEVFDAARTHASYILPAVLAASGVVVGAPTYENSLFPPVAELLRTAAHKHLLNRKTAWFGSHGWSGGAQKEFEAIASEAKWTVLDTFQFCGRPTSEDLKKGAQFGRQFGQAVLRG